MIINDRSTFDIYGTPLLPDDEEALMTGNQYRTKLSLDAHRLLPYRDRLRLLGGGGDFVPRSGESGGPHPLTPEERSAIAVEAWVTRHAQGERATPKGDAAAVFHELGVEYAHTNHRLFTVMDNPSDPRYHEALEDLKRIVRETNRLDIDTGGLEEIGKPGGPRDVVVIGAGPAGMQAAILAGTDGLDTLLLDKSDRPGGQPKTSSRIENLLGFPAGITGNELATKAYDQAQRVGADARLGVTVTAMTVDPQTGMKTLTLSTGETILTRTVIIAGGLELRKTNPDGTPLFEGSDNPHVNYGDGDRLLLDAAGRDAVVLGGSNAAAQGAIGAARTAKHVTVIARSGIGEMSHTPKLGVEHHPDQKISIITDDPVTRLITDHQGRPVEVELRSGRHVPAGAIAVYFGGAPSSDWLPKMIERARNGKVVTDKDMRTAIPGVFAAGDIRDDSIPRISAAMGEGARAEKGLFDYFKHLAAQRINQAVPIPAGAHLRDYRLTRSSADVVRRARLAELDRWMDIGFALDETAPWATDLKDAGGPSESSDLTNRYRQRVHHLLN